MKIAVWHNLPSGGGKRALYHLVKGLLERGHTIESWCPPTADFSFLPFEKLVREHIVPFSWEDPPLRGRLSYLLQPYRDIANNILAMNRHCEICAEQINSGGFDVMLASSCRFFRVTGIGRFVKIPTLLYLHEPNRALYEASPRLPWLALPSRPGPIWTPRAIKRFVKDLVEIQALRLQAREEFEDAAVFGQILVNSFFSRESVLRAYGLEARVCYLGVDSELFRPLGLPRERTVVGLGAIHPSKGVETAIEAVGTIAEERRPELQWIGNFASDEYQKEVVTLANSLGVKFVPRVGVSDEELVDALNRAAVMVYTSRLEPFGFAPLEANACGTPVVAIAEGGVRESVIDGVNGLLVPERRPELLGGALAKMLEEPEWARKLGEGARAHVVDVWNWERSVECVERSLMEVAYGGHGGNDRVG
jgi:glycosyltransferase involved in cell wall biosynthesis